MNNAKVENQLYFKAGLAFDSYKQALKAFETYLGGPGPAPPRNITRHELPPRCR